MLERQVTQQQRTIDRLDGNSDCFISFKLSNLLLTFLQRSLVEKNKNTKNLKKNGTGSRMKLIIFKAYLFLEVKPIITNLQKIKAASLFWKCSI